MHTDEKRKINYDYSDRLERILKEQRDFSSYWTPYDLIEKHESDFSRESYAEDLLLKVYEECAELGKEIHNYNWRAKNSELPGMQISIFEGQKSKVLEELIDVFKYLMNIGFCYGMDADDFYNKFIEKSKINRERRKNSLAEKL